MKNLMKVSLLTLLAALMLFSCIACGATADPVGLWETATYLSDTTVGEGKYTTAIRIEAGDQAITVTVKTDKEVLGDALFELGLVNNAIYFDTLNGMKADNTTHYWAFYEADTLMPVGIGMVSAANKEYRFVYTAI